MLRAIRQMTPGEVAERYAQMDAKDKQFVSEVITMLLCEEVTNDWVHSQLQFIDARLTEACPDHGS
jgi:hypothetical protein